MMRISMIAAALALAFGLAAAGGQTKASDETVTLAIPDRTNSTPWIAAAGDFVAVAWGAAKSGSGDIFVATSRDGGRSFSAPVQVNVTAGEARISGEIAPRVALRAVAGVGTPEITVLWNARHDGTAMRWARSTNGGRSFDTPVTLQASGAPGDRGWGAMTLDAAGQPHAIWLDHRGMAAAKPGTQAEHKGEHDGVAMAQRSSLFYVGGGAVRERELFKGVCYCCKTTMAVASDGAIYAAWRHVFAGNFRDIAFTVSRDAGRTFAPLARVNEDGWSINGCPDDGPAMAADDRGRVHLAWPTVQKEQGTIFYATSQAGQPFSAPTRVPTLGSPKPSHPHVAVARSGRVFVAWDEVQGGVRRAAITSMTGPAFSPPVVLGDATMYPVMASVGNGVVAAWTSGPSSASVIQVRRVE